MRGFLILLSWLLMIGSVVPLVLVPLALASTQSGEALIAFGRQLPQALGGVALGAILWMLLRIDQRLARSGGPF